MKAFSLISIIILWLSFSLHAQDSLSQNLSYQLEQAHTIEQKTKILDKLIAIWEEKDFPQAIGFAKKGLNLAKELPDDPLISHYYFQIGKIFDLQGKYDSSVFYLNQSIEIAQNAKLQSSEARAHERKAISFKDQARYIEALSSLIKAIDLWEEIGNQSGLASSYQIMSDVLYYQERFEEGVEYAYRSLGIHIQEQDSFGIANAHQYIGENFLMLQTYDSALFHITIATDLLKKMEASAYEYGSAANSKGNVYKKMGRLEDALHIYREILDTFEPIDFKIGVSVMHANIGEVLSIQQKYEEALPHMLKAVELSEEIDFKANIIENYGHLSNIYEALEDYKSSLFYERKLTDTKDSIFSLEKDKVLSELRTQYESEKQKTTIDILENKREQQQRFMLLGLTFIGLLMIGIGLIFRSSQMRKRVNKKLEIQNGEILEQKVEIEIQNKQNELLLKEIHHRVKNNLQVIASLLNLQSANIKDSNVKEAVKAGQHRVKSMALIHQKLYQRENLAAVEMKDYLQTLGQSLLSTFGIRKNRIQIESDMEELELDVDTAIPVGLIVNELITNSIKYAFPLGESGVIEYGMSIDEDNLLILNVNDNGIGQASEEASAQGTSFGSRLIDLLRMQLDGEIEVEVSQGRKTTLKFKSYK